MRPLDQVLACLQAPRQIAPGRFQALCSAHQDRRPSLSIAEGEDGRVLLKCWAGCETEKVLSAIGLRFRDLFPGNSIPSGSSQALRPEPRRTQAWPLPRPDRPRLERLLSAAQRGLLVGSARKWLAYRGISLEVARALGVGLLEQARFSEWPGRECRNAWALPICGPDGVPVAVKLHMEERPQGGLKNLWCPFGQADGSGRRRHGCSTLWPPPEWYRAVEQAPPDAHSFLAGLDNKVLFLLPGELKAFAVLGAGLAATAVTGGEAWRWSDIEIARLVGCRVCLVYDDDVAGHKFLTNSVAALHGFVADLRAVTFGAKESS